MQTRLPTFSPRWLAALALAGVLTGCAHTPGSNARSGDQWHSTTTQNSQIPANVQAFLRKGTEQSTAVFEQTPWGGQAELRIESRYFAGSGRECVRLHVAPAGGSSKTAIACNQNNQWVSVRPVTQLLNIQGKG